MAESDDPKGDRNRLPALWKRPASGVLNGDHDRRQRPQAVLLVALKAARQPLAASGVLNGDHDRRQRPQAVLLVALKAAQQPLAASGALNGDHDRRQRRQAVLLVALKAAQRPLAASGALGRWAALALVVQERLAETKATPTLGDPGPCAPPKHKPHPVGSPRASNRERSIVIS
ncbi:MAG: hypothetical protein ACLQCU_06495 [Acidimicrobiales bacterium]